MSGGINIPLVPVGSQQLTVDNTSGGVSLTLPDGAHRAAMTLQTAQIRALDSGTAPTTTLGRVVEIGQQINYLEYSSRTALEKFRAIRTGSTSGVLDIVYYQ